MADWLTPWLQPWWPDATAFLRMGRHGAYVWPAVLGVALALAGEWLGLKRRARALVAREEAVE